MAKPKQVVFAALISLFDITSSLAIALMLQVIVITLWLMLLQSLAISGREPEVSHYAYQVHNTSVMV